MISQEICFYKPTANSYLGGGVWSGGGTQEESMFLEYTELLVTTLLVEKMLPYESVEIEGAKRYIDHNMMASMMASPHLEMSKQFCRPADAVDEATCITVALDAVTNSINLSTSIERYESVLRHLACL